METPSNPPQDLTITRLLDAPRELVFKVWTEPEHVTKWWGPHGYSSPRAEFDLRAGGAFLIDMADGSGNVNPTSGTIQEIVPPEKLVLASRAFPDGKGGYLLEVVNTVTFEAQGGQTLMTMNTRVLKSSPEIAGALAGMEIGWSQSFEKLIVLLDNLKG